MIPIAKPYLTQDEAQAAYDTILTGWITQGPKVQEFEEKFATYTGAKYAVAVSNCTTALHLAMIVAGIGEGDEVICPSMSYIATANAIKYVGATPVFAEVQPNTYNLDPDDAEKRITDKTKAILIVHQIGMPADIDAFHELCEKYNLKLIEDAACAVGSSYKGSKIGSHSELVCFSFHPRKVISTGDGGMITTSREDYYQRLKLLRQHGMSVNDRVRHEANKVIFEDHVEIGYNYRLTDIQAAVGIKQLEKLDWIVAERRKIAYAYNEAFKGIDFIQLPAEEEEYLSNFQSYSIYLKESCPLDRNIIMQELLDKGIASRRGIMNSHRESAYKKLYSNLVLPVSEDLQDNSVILPLFVPMEEKEISSVINTFLSIVVPTFTTT
ncbi:dTDP-4-amino-4,6-dideoxygalactose transaminase [Pontibacter ummariensis]|uniref:GDP-perosamine synthase n=1 Tax=Pontibacter ummariensis TaxID=1610492 RepID=A0A239K3Q5_9BACT|nr:DegT/DnrJ/EryC1/StrS family aminotransferase [Pontibacter ummariensis]PRY06771.1 dTDP-4-amino-4,6-dideoxygalactose transaminase [Pontibacter ummariensis]SNT12977.1 dTDP-4-amino-4,6-dideoxygalactose transaminase [Pontibacter ummariensis]